MFAKTLAILMVAFFGTLGTFLLLQRQFQGSAGAFGCTILPIYYLVTNRTNRRDMRQDKSDIEKIQAPLSTTCPKCGYEIPPHEMLRIDNSQMQCLKCKAIFITAGADR